MSTKTKLVEDLFKKEPGAYRDALIKLAKDGYYHDFETTLATPKITLHDDLMRAGYLDLAQNVIDGDYDE